MDAREKLIEILKQAPFEGKVLDEWWWEEKIKMIADHLIANSVTVQKWISVKDRLPTIYDTDDDNCVLAIHKATNKRYYHWRSVANNPFDFTYCTRTLHPPKGE